MKPPVVDGIGVPWDGPEPIAVVGIATRFSQEATSTEKLWEIMQQEKSTWSPVPKERFNAEAFYHPDPEHGGTFSVQGGHFFAEDPAYFDSSFFNVTKTELMTLDPQQRLVMENVYHALENAGITLSTAYGSNTAVFVSGFNRNYLEILSADPETSIKYKPTGPHNSILSNRVSWFFDFKGPSMTIDTACSSSLVAIHLAVQSLRARDTSMAVVSGVSILENPIEIVGMSHHGLLGPQGRSFSFDSRAEGYARGEGVGTVILKPLSIAVKDGDTIRAVIREIGVNQDGRTSGMTVPSANAQETLIREVYRRAGLDVKHTMFVEAHGTGTSTGDPIEASAIAHTFMCQRETPLYIGTIKSSIGHLEGGSGVASIIKSILILESGIIPPNFDIQQVNPKILASDWNIAFPTKNTPWPTAGLRRVSVNSFGIGGTNSHCILDDAYHYLSNRNITASHQTESFLVDTHVSKSSRNSVSSILDSSDDTSHISATGELSCSVYLNDRFEVQGVSDNPRVFMLSAFDEDGVNRNASAYSHYFSRESVLAGANRTLLDDFAFTLLKKRSVFPWRSFVLASTAEQLAFNLSESRFDKPVRATFPPEVSFVFTGQGAQYKDMGRALLAYPVFKQSLERASEYIRHLGSPYSLIDELLTTKDPLRIHLPDISQPLCTILQVAIVDLLASWHIFPTRVIGHSSGEIAAAYCAGKISREAAWKVAEYRGYVSSKQLSAYGAMLAVGLSVSELEPHLKAVQEIYSGELIIACYNSPRSNTVSGDEALVGVLRRRLIADGVFSRQLNVKNAYHSAHMQAISDDYLHLMGDISSGTRLVTPYPVRMFSTVTGKEVTEDLPSQYWVDNMVSPVRFTSVLSSMHSDTAALLDYHSPEVLPHIIEIGPHSTLQSAIKDTLAAKNPQTDFKYLAVLKRTDPSLNVLLGTVGTLAASGYELDLHAVNLECRSAKKLPKLLVNLPPYCFKHAEKVLYESRLSKNLRARKYPRHDLFGAPVPDWNSNAPRWRHFVRLNENPWLRDHQVTGNFVYPGVGYLVMAIEAARQLSADKSITGFQLHRISIRRALIIPDTKDGIEVCLSMTIAEGTSDSRLWHRFQISSYNESSNEWTEHCIGNIAVEYKEVPDPIDNGREADEEVRSWKEDLETARAVCGYALDSKKLYDDLQAAGLNFGPLFRNLREVKVSGSRLGSMIGVVTIPDIAQSMPKRYMHSHLIHPATMDSMIHMMIATVLDMTGRTSLDCIRLPTYIHDVWVSADLSSIPTHRFTGHASGGIATSGKFEGWIRMLNDVGKPQIRIDGIELTPLETTKSDIDRKLCTAIEWKPDVHFLDSQTACDLSYSDEMVDQDRRNWIKSLQLTSMLLITDALVELKDLDPMKLDSHMRRFYDWMMHVFKLLENDKIIHLAFKDFQEVSQSQELKESLFKTVEQHNAEGIITVRMGRKIASIVRKEADPLHLMFGQDNIMESYYKDGIRLYNLPSHLKRHLSLLRHQHCELKILEIGSGTGSFTAEVLNVLAPDGARGSIASYTFTDISSGFFEKAKQRFQPWNKIMTFQPLNLEDHPIDQGLEYGVYDLIFAGNVIHATANLQATLANLQLLLKPGGQLVMQEGIRQDFLALTVVFGQLPGWWLGDEPIRQWCPYIPVSEWNNLLIKSGFSGVDIEYPSSNNEDLSLQSILISTALPALDKPLKDVFVLTTNATQSKDYIASIRSAFEASGLAIHVVKLSELNYIADAACISIVDMEKPFLYEICEEEYLALRKVLMTFPKILWVTADFKEHPFSAMSMGLLRTVRWERDADDSSIATVAIADVTTVSEKDVAACIYKIFSRQFKEMHENERNSEYLLKDGIIHIGHLREWEEADTFLAMQASKLTTKLQNFEELDSPIELSPTALKRNEVYWVPDSHHLKPLGESEVEVKIQAMGLNSDIHALNPSTEASGVVKTVGSAVKCFIPGNRVIVLTGDQHRSCLRTLVRLDESLVVDLPTRISFSEGAALPFIFATAIHGLAHTARLSEKDIVLIPNGASALGQAAIQYANIVKAKIFTTVKTPEDKAFLADAFEIPEDNIFSSNDLSFIKGVMRCTKGTGVDVIFNTLASEAQLEMFVVLAPFGRFIDAAGKGTRATAQVDLSSLQRNVTFANIDIYLMAQHRPVSVRRLVTYALKLYLDGKIRQAQPFRIMDLARIKDGLQLLHGDERVGQIVLVPNRLTAIPLVQELLPPFQFDETGSYVLAGGLGGLGRNLARWMASRSAKTLIILSRAVQINAEGQKMVSDLRMLGCSVHIFPCDVSDAKRLKAVVDKCSETLPPIKGCIQGSMVLRDGTFAGMSFDDWQIATRPKVQGSWNLHTILPSKLDFFVMLSSVAGIIGNRGQANYAAGNSFQDALATFRTSHGMNASSINLGSVSDVGWVAENRDRVNKNSAPLFEFLSDKEVQGALEFLMDPRYEKHVELNACPRSQLVLGLPTAEMCRQNDIPAPSYLNYSLFKHFQTSITVNSSETNKQITVSTAALLSTTSSPEEAIIVVSNGIVERLASLLAIPASEIDAKRFSFGSIDSLVSMEFHSWISKELKAEVSLLEIIGAQNIRALSEKIVQISRLSKL
ncbi:Acyl transferase/acyl hydrolase/lysophospholipase [Penicillium taxi]|uniref:Acyl transferase/acyl hydrolase/lysophospholipase n=1 Tax=Penicillium taxi TaxID=168475 RepID=UPI002545AEB3|nr:Acyl transferase/acyl hydrolase/lysophospholipase [Penicillium taxi]KAJ5888770.1 Acyl transferase/acyl hydrolase/lysophospholipase [Penicillium taxi]